MFKHLIDKIFAQSSNTINQHFDKVYVISLPSEIEQHKFIKQYFDKYNINFELFYATNGADNQDLVNHYDDYLSWSFDDPRSHPLEKKYHKKLIKSVGALGLLDTYRKIFEKIILNKKINNVLIFEDDVIFDKYINRKLNLILKHIKKYDLLYLGASHHVWKKHDIIKLQDTGYYKAPIVLDGSFATAYNRNVFKPILNEIYKYNAPIDLVFRNILEKDNSYVVYPNIVIAETTRTSTTSYQKRKLKNHASKVKWDLSNIDYSRGILKTSILIASHNNKKTIKNAVDSALNQTYKNIEVIVVDDHSTDGSLEILKSYKDKIKLIRLKTNRGAYYARNVALDNSSGFFITLMDADDIMLSKKIEIDVHNYYNNPQCEIFLSNIYRGQFKSYIDDISDANIKSIIEEERSPFIYTNGHSTPFGRDTPWNFQYRLGLQTIFVEKEFFIKYGPWRNDYRYGMDIELIQRYVLKKYNKFIDNQSLFKIIHNYQTKDNLGIFLSETMNYFSYPLNNNNATKICCGEERKNIHKQINTELVNTLSKINKRNHERKIDICDTRR